MSGLICFFHSHIAYSIILMYHNYEQPKLLNMLLYDFGCGSDGFVKLNNYVTRVVSEHSNVQRG